MRLGPTCSPSTITGATTTEHDASGSTHVAVSADGLHLGLSKAGPGGGTSLVDLASGALTALGPDGIVQAFSPDGLLVEVLIEANNSLVVSGLDGTPAFILADPNQVGWIAAVDPSRTGVP